MKRMLWILAVVLVLVGCESADTLTEVQENYMKYNEAGVAFMEEEDFQAALESFEKANGFSEGDDAALNNLSWAYYALGEYEKSLEMIQLALAIEPNSAEEFVNFGNAIMQVGSIEDAVLAYQSALEINPEEDIAFYGLGVAYFYMGMYKESVDAFESSLIYDSIDKDAMLFKAQGLIAQEEYILANTYLDQVMARYPDFYDFYEAKGEVLQAIDKTENVKTYYESLMARFPENMAIYFGLAAYYYDINAYDEAIEVYHAILDFEPTYDAYMYLSYIYKNRGEFDQARKYADEMIELNDNRYEGVNALGNILLDEGKYLESLVYFDQAIDLTYDTTPIVNKMYALKSAKRYTRCIDFGNEVIASGIVDPDVSWYIAECYYEKNDFEKTIELFSDYINDYPEAVLSYYYLTNACEALGQQEEAIEYGNRLVEHYPNDETARNLLDYVSRNDEDAAELITDLFDHYYLYDYAATKMKKVETDQGVVTAFNKMLDSNDPYSYVIYGDMYLEYSEPMTSLLFVEIDSESYYTHIPYFDGNTDHLFIEHLDQIENPQDKRLIIDLTENGGGSTDSANYILDALLPDCLTSQIIYKDGYTYSYYSDATMVPFKEIVILVNENTASAAELLTLGLKTYLDNVVVIGETTHGKGVGQYVYDDKVHKRLYYVVNHYWNVREYNVTKNKIVPDIKVAYNLLYDYVADLYDY